MRCSPAACGAPTKDGALASAGIDRPGSFTVSIHLVLEEMALRSLIPVVAGLSPMDAADLVHAEAHHIGKRLAARAVADGRNLLLDVTMGSQPSVQSWRPRTLRNLGPESLAKHRPTPDTGHAWRNPASG